MTPDTWRLPVPGTGPVSGLRLSSPPAMHGTGCGSVRQTAIGLHTIETGFMVYSLESGFNFFTFFNAYFRLKGIGNRILGEKLF